LTTIQAPEPDQVQHIKGTQPQNSS